MKTTSPNGGISRLREGKRPRLIAMKIAWRFTPTSCAASVTVSSDLLLVAGLSGFLILVLHFLAGSGLKRSDHRSGNILAELEYDRLLFTFLILEADGQIMPTLLRKQNRQGTDSHRSHAQGNRRPDSATGVLTIGKACDRIVPKRVVAAFLGGKNQMGRIAGIQLSLDPFRNGDRATDIQRFLGIKTSKSDTVEHHNCN